MNCTLEQVKDLIELVFWSTSALVVVIFAARWFFNR